MRRTVIGVLMLAVLVVVPSVASAQAKQGDREVLVFGQTATLFLKSGLGGSSTQTSGTFFANVGQFITDRAEVGGGPSIVITSGGGNGTHAGIGFNVFGRYFFDLMNPKLKPYVGGEYQIQEVNPENGSATDTQFVNGVFGIKDYLSDKTALDVKGAYGFRPNAAGDFQILTFTVGFSFLF